MGNIGNSLDAFSSINKTSFLLPSLLYLLLATHIYLVSIVQPQRKVDSTSIPLPPIHEIKIPSSFKNKIK